MNWLILVLLTRTSTKPWPDQCSAGLEVTLETRNDNACHHVANIILLPHALITIYLSRNSRNKMAYTCSSSSLVISIPRIFMPCIT